MDVPEVAATHLALCTLRNVRPHVLPDTQRCPSHRARQAGPV